MINDHDFDILPGACTNHLKKKSFRATWEDFDGEFRPYLQRPRLRGDYEFRWHPVLLRYNTVMGVLRRFKLPFYHFMKLKQVKLKRSLASAGLRMRKPNEHTITKAEGEIMVKCQTG